MNEDARINPLLSLAQEKLTLLGEMCSRLSRFVSDEGEQSAEEIQEIFAFLSDTMTQLQKLDRTYAEKSVGVNSILPSSDADVPMGVGVPAAVRLCGILNDQRRAARQTFELVRQASEKATVLSEQCRNGLRGVQQRKWICAQLQNQTLKPGSLLDYSESLHTL